MLVELNPFIVVGVVVGIVAGLLTIQKNWFKPYIETIEQVIIDCESTVYDLTNNSAEGTVLRVYFYVRKAFYLFRNLVLTALLFVLGLRIFLYWGIGSDLPIPALVAVALHILIIGGLAFIALGSVQKRYGKKFKKDNQLDISN